MIVSARPGTRCPGLLVIRSESLLDQRRRRNRKAPTGKVMRVGGILGRKNVRTEEPGEHVDTKILETLMQLDPGRRLPLGLSVDGYVANPSGKQPD